MTDTKAQLSYEYLIVIGMILIIITPFFYQLFGGLNTRISETWAVETATIVADATKTVQYLGPGNSLLVNVRLNGVVDSVIENNKIDLTLSNGEGIYANGAENIVSGEGTLTGTGLFNVPIQSNKLGLGVIIGNKPAILCMVDENTIPQRIEDCANPQLRPEEAFDIHGGNFYQDSQIVIQRYPAGRTIGGTQLTIKDSQEMQVGHVLGVGTYDLYVENDKGKSNTVRLTISSKKDK